MRELEPDPEARPTALRVDSSGPCDAPTGTSTRHGAPYLSGDVKGPCRAAGAQVRKMGLNQGRRVLSKTTPRQTAKTGSGCRRSRPQRALWPRVPEGISLFPALGSEGPV
jgi:hypothetical protein